jgi:hypothetical protein
VSIVVLRRTFETRAASPKETHMPADPFIPIPVGPPHLTIPPFFDRWGVTSSRTRRLEKRDYDRKYTQCDLWLIDLSSQSILRCKTNNVSDAGLHAFAPVGFGLAVGQRYEIRLAPPNSTPRPLSDHWAKSLGYATVIRTEIHVGDEKPDHVGFAVRFDVPQLLPVH